MKKEKQHKTRRAAFLLLAVLLSLSLPALAVAGAEAAPITEEAPIVTTAPTVIEAPAEEVSATLGEAVGDFLREHLSGILSGATLAVTLVASLAVRRRILPPLVEALSSLLGKSREAVGAITEGNEATRIAVDGVLQRAEELLTEARATAERADESSRALKESLSDRGLLAKILTEQSTMLYELLMSANLPQYEKDRIGNAHAAVLDALRAEVD